MNDDQHFPRAGASGTDVLDRLRAANPSSHLADARNDLRARLDLDRILIGDITGDSATVGAGQGTDTVPDVPSLAARRARRAAAAAAVDQGKRPLWRRPAPWIAAAAATVVAAGAIGVGVLQPGPAPLARADTPAELVVSAPAADTPAAATLRQLADLALQQQALPAGTWRYTESVDYSLVQSFYREDGKDVEAVQVLPSRNRYWLAADGKVHLESVSAGGSDAWSSNGRIDPSLIDPAGSSTDDHTVPDADSALDLPTDPAQLTALLDGDSSGPPARGGTVAGYLDDLYNRTRTGLPSPAQQAALWRVLADTGELKHLGTATDRAGRAAVVVAYDTTGELAGHKRYELLIDPQTGLLLAHEEIALKTSSTWAQQAPAVMGSTTWLASASTDTLDVPASTGNTPRG